MKNKLLATMITLLSSTLAHATENEPLTMTIKCRPAHAPSTHQPDARAPVFKIGVYGLFSFYTLIVKNKRTGKEDTYYLHEVSHTKHIDHLIGLGYNDIKVNYKWGNLSFKVMYQGKWEAECLASDEADDL